MEIKVYWKSHDVEVIETTALASDGVAGGKGAGRMEGPGAAAFWRESLSLGDWGREGIVLRRAFGPWDGTGELSMRDAQGGPAATYLLFSADELREKALEVYVDGISVLARDQRSELRYTDEIDYIESNTTEEGR